MYPHRDDRGDLYKLLLASGPDGVDLQEHFFPGVFAHIMSLEFEGVKLERRAGYDRASHRHYDRLVLLERPVEDDDGQTLLSVQDVREAVPA